MRVLHLIDSLGRGGSERSLAELLPCLAAQGIAGSVLVLVERRAALVEPLVAAGFSVERLPGRRLPGRVAALRRRLRAERPDLLHTSLFASDLVGRLAAAGTGVPVLSSVVQTSYDADRWRALRLGMLKRRLVRAVDGWTARHLAAHLHAVSGPVAQHAVEHLGVAAERVTVVDRGRDSRRLGEPGRQRRERVRRALGLPLDAPLVLNVGRRDPAKGQQHLVVAAADLARRRPDLVVLVAGRSGPATPFLDRLRRDFGLEGVVRFLDHRDDLPDLLAAADVLAVTSSVEGMPGAVLEAMALGVPVVAFDIPTVAEVVEADDSALLVPPGEPAALAAAIERVLADPELAARLGRRGRELFAARFTLAASARGMTALYRRLVPEAS
ncbi:MAG TPA: glycosyltransferase family 4 protein [Thermoanaerobaculia bacterium]